MVHAFDNDFQQLCHQKGLAVTHQRLVLYRALMQMTDHPNPEQVFERVRLELPSISLATVYKTLHVFLEAGMIREVSAFHGSLRIEPDAQHHHHFICLQCHDITDLALSEIDDVAAGKFCTRRFPYRAGFDGGSGFVQALSGEQPLRPTRLKRKPFHTAT